MNKSESDSILPFGDSGAYRGNSVIRGFVILCYTRAIVPVGEFILALDHLLSMVWWPRWVPCPMRISRSPHRVRHLG